MAVMFPLDDDGHPIPVLGFDYRGTQKLAVGDVSTRHAAPIPSDIEIVSLIATGMCRFEVGDAGVTADPAQSPVLFPGQYVECRCAMASAGSPSSPRASPAKPT